MPKAKLQIAFVHDHTASMGGLRAQVRRNNCSSIDALGKFCDDHDIELWVGVVSILDLHDEGGKDMVGLQLTKDRARVKRHLMNVPDARGNSSGEECYERVPHLLRSWEWDEGATKAVIFTGDSVPHPRTHRKNPDKLVFEDELRAFVEEQDVRVYAVQAMTGSSYGADPFWRSMGEIGNAPVTKLEQMEDINIYLLGIAAREAGKFEAFEQTLGPISYAVQRSMDQLAGRKVRAFKARNSGRAVAAAGRFQVHTIDEEIPASEFFRDIGIISDISEYGDHKGELFYAHEVRPSEELRPNHEVIIQDDVSGEMIFGEDARAMLGIPYGTRGQKVKRNQLKAQGYTIWIQTKSVGNARHLEAGQRVMVDLSPTSGFGQHRAPAMAGSR